MNKEIFFACITSFNIHNQEVDCVTAYYATHLEPKDFD